METPLMDEYRSSRSRIDWASRMLALLSLLVAGGTLYVAQFRPASTESANSIEYAEQKFAEYDKAIADGNQQMVDAMAKFVATGERVTEQLQEEERTAQDTRHTVFRQQLSRHDARYDDFLAGLGSSAQPTAGNPDRQPINTVDSAIGPSLRLARMALKPNGAADRSVLTVQNEGDEDAVITTVRFQPRAEFKAPKEDFVAGQDAQRKLFSIEFVESDNLSEPGDDKVYQQGLRRGIVVPAGESVVIRLSIQNEKYLGWGFTGDASLLYRGEKGELEIRDVEALFRPDDDTSDTVALVAPKN